MLYFTFTSGKTRGIFSGRFAFKVHDEIDGDGNSDSLVASIEESAITDFGKTLEHEQTHHTISTCSNLGVYLIGLRFLARISFALGYRPKVEAYYAKRTIYFVLGYRFHEAMVDRLLKKQRSFPTKLETLAVARLDHHVEIVASIVGIPLRVQRLSFSFLAGSLAVREFGVMLSVRTANGTIKVREASTRKGFSGIFNAAFQPSKRDGLITRAIKFTHRMINIETISLRFGNGLTNERLFTWSCIKLHSEYKVISGLYVVLENRHIASPALRVLRTALRGNTCADDYFRKYLTSIIPFALKYQGEEPHTFVSDTFNLIEELLAAVQRGNFETLTPRSKYLFTKVGGLFFYHGN